MKAILPLVICLSLAACGTNRVVYQSPDFKEKAARHQTIAILPFHIVQTGHVGKNENRETIKESNEKWGYAFQESLQASALKYTSRNRKGQPVSFQAIQKTNAFLKEGGLTIDDLYSKKPEDVAKLLGVDAVLMTTVENDKNFSDGVAYAAAAGRAIINVISKNGSGNTLGVNASDINMNSYLYDAADSKLLWKTYRQGGTDLPSNVDGLVEYYSNWIAKKLPYKS
jgi:hypothetical protein